MEVTFILIVLILLQALNGMEGTFQSSYYIVHKDKYMSTADSVKKEISAVNFQSCAAQCSSSSECGTASYEETANRCMMFELDSTHQYERDHYLTTNIGWKSASKVMYPVMLLIGSGGHYTLDFDAAKSRCFEEGYSVASPDDLRQARAMGFQYCSCGWLSDQTSGFVLQERDTVCWGSYNTDIIYCGMHTVNVWCKTHWQ